MKAAIKATKRLLDQGATQEQIKLILNVLEIGNFSPDYLTQNMTLNDLLKTCESIQKTQEKVV